MSEPNPFAELLRPILSRPGDPRGDGSVQLKAIKTQREAAGGRVHLMEDDEKPLQQVAAPKTEEQPMAYEPRGKVAVLADAMRGDPRRIWTSPEVAKVMDVSQGAVSAHLDAAIRNGALYRKLEHGRCQYALRPFPAAPTPAPAAPEPRIPVFSKDFHADALPPQHGDETARASVPSPAPTSAPVQALSHAEDPVRVAAAEAFRNTFHKVPAQVPMDWWQQIWAKAVAWAVSTQPADEMAEMVEPVKFNAGLWADGELIVYGGQENEDGSRTYSAEQTRILCRLLHGQAPES